jgi:hypothetical protein
VTGRLVALIAAASGADRIGVERLAEGASGEFARQFERRLAVLGRERANIDEGGYLVATGGVAGSYNSPGMAIRQPRPGASDKPSDNAAGQRQTEHDVLRHRNPFDLR